ncbi:hypothetical protein H5U35_09185 [Candidatus Aerophobetes bacterium]|nr:hypothetical protein [Candidatus Aerophobetes bacterium]
MSPFRETKEGMTQIVKTIAKFVVPPIILFGVYLVVHGHLTPGGGFPGGVIIASAFILLVLSFGKEVTFQKMKISVASVLESVGALIFLAVALIGMAVGGWFFYNFLPKGHPLKIISSGSIPFSNVGIGIKVAGGVFAVFLTLIAFRIKSSRGGR